MFQVIKISKNPYGFIKLNAMESQRKNPDPFGEWKISKYDDITYQGKDVNR